MKKSCFTVAGLSIIFLLLTSCNPLHKLALNPEITKWEQEVSDLEKMPVSTDDKTILFSGSSSIRLWETVSADMLPYKSIARGYGGAKLSDYVYYAHRIVSMQHCGAIVLFIANDITGDPKDISPEEVFKLYKMALHQIRKSHPGTPVFWIEITPTPSRWNSWEKVSRANQLIRNYTGKKDKLFYIQTSHRFLNSEGLPDEQLFIEDKLHLNEKGYELWSRCIKEQLDSHLPQLQELSR